MATVIEEKKIHSKLESLLEENSEKLLTCVHCGLCLPSCPTYRELGNENDSPRGRVYLMRGVVENKINIGDAFITHIDLCLGCRACESACPSSVPYGHLLEAARAEVSEARIKRGSLTERVTRFVLNQIFTRPRLLRMTLGAARLARDSGLARLAFDSELVSGRLRFALALLVATRSPLARRKRTSEVDMQEQAEKSKMTARVAILEGCVMESLFTETNRATERVLVRNGCEIVKVKDQMCCGALHAHAGQIETARELARKNIDAFLKSGAARVIVNAAGCGAAMKEYAALLADDEQYLNRAREFGLKVRDVSEFLMEIGVALPTKALGRRVTYDAPCHLIHAQRIAQAPIEVLKAIPGLEVVPLRGYENCCGGAGIYNLQHTELSAEILSEKLESIEQTRADAVATANPGCIMQIGAGALMNGLKVDVVHPIELLDAAYAESNDKQR
jgi:glycolate oxidase iron-sulfur subunit